MDLYNIIINYIKKFNFDDYIKSIGVELSDENYQSFTEEFWLNPSTNLTKLKSKHDIPNAVPFSSILMQHPTIKYLSLISDCWDFNSTIEDIVKKYGIPFQKINQIIFSIPFNAENLFCTECLTSNEFTIENNIKDSNYIVTCSNCNSRVSHLISDEESEQILEKLKIETDAFRNEINYISNNLAEIKCPNCHSELELIPNFINLEYTIQCTKCNTSYDHYDDVSRDYHSWRQRAAMMIKIKAKEDEMLEELLNSKIPEDIKVKVEDLIKNDESIETIVYLASLDDSLDNNEVFIQLFKKIKSSSRLAKMLLINICELIDRSSKDLSTWTYNNNNEVATRTRYLVSEEPIISLLHNVSKILPVRIILRELINVNLVYCNEEENKLHVHPSLIDNLVSIKNLLKPQNVAKEVSWLIFNKQNYTCYHCGENGRPLKVCYLDSNKNSANLNSLIGVCDLCFDDVTEDEIYIDLMISGTEEYENESSISWKFLETYYPHFSNDDEAFTSDLNLLNVYNESDIIKAYAATIDKFTRDNKRGNFFAYADAILRNSEDGVNINSRIKKIYNVDEWLSKI